MTEAEQNFSQDILVNCPRCGARAHVTHAIRMICPSCGLHHQRDNVRLFGENGICFQRNDALRDWYGWVTPLILNDASCSHCGNRLILKLERQMRESTPAINTQAQASCDTCNKAQTVDIIWVPYSQPNEPYDRHFGAALFLVEHTPKGTLFALNRTHAQVLLSYIASDLRGQVEQSNSNLFSMLPSWVKSAKNRHLVEKMLKRLIDKAGN